MKSLMNILLICLIPALSIAQEIQYFGSNGKPVNSIDEAREYRMIKSNKNGRAKVNIYALSNGEWVKKSSEKYTPEGTLSYQVKRSNQPACKLQIEESSPGLYHFTETARNGYRRTGFSSSLPPLHLEGTVEEFYPRGTKKSISEYKNNQLLSNQNWRTDGSHYIDSIFYSVDQEPEFSMGNKYFNDYVLSRMNESGFDFTMVEDRMVFGWVIMEDGSLDGVVALKGKSLQLKRFFMELFTGMPGDWQPGKLDGKPVRTFMTIPINISSPSVNFQEMEISDNQLNFNKY